MKRGLYLEEMNVFHDKGFNNEEQFWRMENTENEKEKEKIRCEIFENNLAFVHYIIKKRVKGIRKTCEYSRTTYDEFFSIGTSGLWKAICTFDVTKGIKFSTFSSRVIGNDVGMFLRSVKRSYGVSSLNAAIAEDEKGDEMTLMDLLADEVDLLSSFEDLDVVDKCLRHITKKFSRRDAKIFMMHLLEVNQKDIGKRFKISQSYVCRVIRKIQKEVSYAIEGAENL